MAPVSPTPTFKTFDGLEIDISGYKQAANGYIEVSARAGDKSADAEAQQINARVQGWDYQVADYRYDEIFQSLDGLLQPLPVKKPRQGTPQDARLASFPST